MFFSGFYKLVALSLLIWCFPCLLPAGGVAQEASPDSLRIVELMKAAKYQAVVELVDSVQAIAAQSNRQSTPAVLFLREQGAYAYDRLGREEIAMNMVNEVIEDAEAVDDVRTIVEGKLTRALLWEKLELWESCSAQLQQVAELLRHHDLPSALARYYVRYASYHRFAGGLDTVGKYAELAIAHGKSSGFVRAVVDGAFLYSVAHPTDKKGIYEALEDAENFCREKGCTDLSAYVRFVRSARMMEFGDLDRAFEINKGLLDELALNPENDHLNSLLRSRLYSQRAELLKGRNEFEPAYDALVRSAEYQEAYYLRLQDQNLSDIENRERTERQDAALREKQLEVNYQKRRKKHFLWGLIVMKVLVGLLIYLVFRLRRIRRDLAANADQLNIANGSLELALDEQVMLRSELHHRVKNNLQVIISLLELQEDRETNPNTKSILRSTAERVFSIAAVHELLYPKQQSRLLRLDRYLNKLCEHSAAIWPSDCQPTFALEACDRSFNLDTLVPLGIMLSELLTNTRKIFPASRKLPRISITLREPTNGVYLLEYRDNGPGFPEDRIKERQGGLGTYLIRSMTRQLRGNFKTFNDQGAVTQISFREKTSSPSTDSRTVPGATESQQPLIGRSLNEMADASASNSPIR